MKISNLLSPLWWGVIAVLPFGVDAAQASNRTYDGYLLDKQCSEAVRHDSNPLDFIMHHTRDCCLMLNCQKKGYCLYTNGTWLTLDSQGNKLAISALKQSQKNSAIYVRMQGVAKKGLLIVKSVAEIQQPNSLSVSGDGQNAQ